MKIKRIHILLFLFLTVLCVFFFRRGIVRLITPAILTVKGKHTVADRVDQFGESVRERLMPDFEGIGVEYPPSEIIFVGIKDQEILEVWVSKEPKLLKTYPILGASGRLGPKLQEGDGQVPEGLYKIESLNPNSMFHLSLRINYPNKFDKSMGKLDGRDNLGGDIMIHGSRSSIGCLAMGDPAAEELFILAAETGIDNISVILSPVDFRKQQLPDDMPAVPKWTKDLYDSIKIELNKLQN